LKNLNKRLEKMAKQAVGALHLVMLAVKLAGDMV
jgi:hypothetical protein